jgi:hypothetical protein
MRYWPLPELLLTPLTGVPELKYGGSFPPPMTTDHKINLLQEMKKTGLSSSGLTA